MWREGKHIYSPLYLLLIHMYLKFRLQKLCQLIKDMMMIKSDAFLLKKTNFLLGYFSWL